MKILHLLYESKGDFFGIGGVGVRAYEIYQYLKDRHSITLLCKKYPGARDGYRDGLKHIYVGTESRNLVNTFLSYAYHAVLFVKKNSHEYDIIVEEFSPAIPTFLHVFTEKPIILQVQGYTGKLYFLKYNPVYALFLYIMEYRRPKFYDNFIFVNAATVQKFPLGSKKLLKIIPNAISHALLGTSPKEDHYILYLGRIEISGKGLDTLINAYREFCTLFPDIKLIVAGDGRDRDKFKAKLMKLPEHVRKNIEFLGWVTGDKKMDIITRALFVVFPSRHEVQPITLLEVMACGKTVIVSDIPEFNFVVEQRAGISFKSGDVLSLVQSMKDLMNSNERKEMGQRGRDLVRNSTWDKVALKYEDFLYRILER
jgi:glycogen(starch) synthase